MFISQSPLCIAISRHYMYVHSAVINWESHSQRQHAVLDMYLMNNNFLTRSKDIIS